MFLEGLDKEVALELGPKSPARSRGRERTVSIACRWCHMALSHLLGPPVWELGVTVLAVAQTHDAEDGMVIVAGEFVSQAKGKLVGSRSKVPVWLRGTGPLCAQGGGQLSEGGIWELVEKPLKAGVPPDLETEMRAGHQCCSHPLPLPSTLPGVPR